MSEVTEVTPVTRRTHGIAHTLHVIRCPECRWKTEVRNEALAEKLRRLHECLQEGAQA